MLIQTYEHSYQVISHILSNELGEIYICRDIATDLECTLLRIKDKEIVPGLMVYLNNCIKDSFLDFITRFVFEGDLCLVFRYHRGITLANKLTNEYCSLSERLMMGKKIWDKVLLLEMPPYFLKNCLSGGNIIVSPSLDIAFNYMPYDIHDFAAADGRAVLKAFTLVFNMLFADELRLESAPPINQFHLTLQRELEPDYIELYKQYIQMSREVELIPEEEIKKPKSRLFLLWERMKQHFKVFKRFLGVALLVIAIIYLAYTVSDFVNPKNNPVTNFDSIGTLKIDQLQ